MKELSLTKEMVGQSFTITRPLGNELFIAGASLNSHLPTRIEHDPVLREEAAKRRGLVTSFDEICEKLFDPMQDIDIAIRGGELSQLEADSFYSEITDFLRADPNHARLLLYLPKQLLPSFVEGQTTEAANMFKEAYLDAWIQLLHETEPRANFVDGDILESGLGEPPHMSKAGHLVPDLLTKGLIDPEYVTMLLEFINDPNILQSLAEGAITAGQRGLLHEVEKNAVKKILNDKQIDTDTVSRNTDYHDPASPLISSERRAWLEKVEIEKAKQHAADDLARHIISGEAIDMSDEDIALALITAGEIEMATDPEKAMLFALETKNMLMHLWDVGDLPIMNDIIGGLNRWTKLGIVSQDYLEEFDINPIDLSNPTPTDSILNNEFGSLLTASEVIKEDPVLSKAIYPLLVVFGSRIKGYADLQADKDVAIFFRPEARKEDREVIRDRLHTIPGLEDISKTVTYWTTDRDGTLSLEPQGEDDRINVGEEQIHFFLGGVWVGDRVAIQKIQNDIVGQYLDLSRYGDRKDDVRMQYLRQLELDLLQYRLMHKGYQKFYPTLPRKVDEASLMDEQSIFWDPGFRRVATKLFLSRVFLPDLSKSTDSYAPQHPIEGENIYQ